MIRFLKTGKLFIGLDSSTTSAKAVAWTREGRAVAEGRCPLETASPAPGLAEQDPHDWWSSSAEALRQCVEQIDLGDVAALAVTVQRETFALLDERGEPVCPAILWYDARGADYLPALREQLGAADYLRVTGKQLDVTSAVCKMAWMRDHAPDALARMAFWSDVLAYISFRMTGNLTTTWAGVDTTGLVSLNLPTWHNPCLDAAGLARPNMPGLVPPGGRLGTLTPDAARETGLLEGTPVFAGGGDGHCFSLGAGRGRRDVATVTLGTSAVLGLTTTDPWLTGDEFRTLLACIRGTRLLESVIQCGSATVGWLRETFLPGPAARACGMDAMEQACAAVPPGSDGLLVLPYWRGVRVPHNDPLARGVALGWTDAHTLAHFHRAIMEGIAMEMALLLARIARRLSVAPARVVLGGGAAASDVWCQILADVLDLPCERPDTLETTSLGAALCAVATCRGEELRDTVRDLELPGRLFRPDPDAVRRYAALRPVYARLYDATRDLAHALRTW